MLLTSKKIHLFVRIFLLNLNFINVTMKENSVQNFFLFLLSWSRMPAPHTGFGQNVPAPQHWLGQSVMSHLIFRSKTLLFNRS